MSACTWAASMPGRTADGEYPAQAVTSASAAAAMAALSERKETRLAKGAVMVGKSARGPGFFQTLKPPPTLARRKRAGNSSFGLGQTPTPLSQPSYAQRLRLRTGPLPSLVQDACFDDCCGASGCGVPVQ